MDPLPGYFYDWQLARWIGGGTTADDIAEMPESEVQQARIVMGAINKADHDAHKKQSGGRKR